MTALSGLVKSSLADRQFRAGLDLMSSSALNAVAGLAFWFVAARTFDESVVGVNAALISVMILVANLASLGMKNGLIRFMPSYGSAADSLVGRVYATTGLVTVTIAPLAALGLGSRVDEISLFGSVEGVVAFSLGCLLWTIFALQDSVLVGLGSTKLVPISNLVYSTTKLAALVLLALSAPKWGIFIAWVVPLIVVIAWVNMVVLRSLRTYRPTQEVEPEHGLARFAIGEHAATMLRMVLVGLLPVFVLDELGERASAFYAMAWTIAYSLMLANTNVSTALLAEAAHGRGRLSEQAGKALKQMAIFVLPVALAVVLLAPVGLRVFGSSYSSEGTDLLRLLALAAIANIPVAVSIGMLRAKRQVARLFGVFAVRSVLIGGLCVVLARRYGLTGCGWGWLIGEATLALVLLVVHLRAVLATLAPYRLVELLSRLKARVRGSRATRRLGPLAESLFPSAAGRELISVSSDAAVFRVEQQSGSAVILKVGSSSVADEQLKLEAGALEELANNVELGDFRALIAKVESQGQHESGRWFTQSVIAGVPTSAIDTETDTLVAAAVAALTPLHDATAQMVIADDEVLDRLVSTPVATVARWRPDLAEDLAAIVTRLRRSLHGHELQLSTIHGDYAPANVIWDLETDSVCGIVDWELSEQAMPAEVDLVHYCVALLTHRRRAEYGNTIIWLLGEGAESPEAVSALGATNSGPNRFDLDTALVLTWLHHVAFNLQKSTGYRKNPVWLTQNVDRVVDGLQIEPTRAQPE